MFYQLLLKTHLKQHPARNALLAILIGLSTFIACTVFFSH